MTIFPTHSSDIPTLTTQVIDYFARTLIFLFRLALGFFVSRLYGSFFDSSIAHSKHSTSGNSSWIGMSRVGSLRFAALVVVRSCAWPPSTFVQEMDRGDGFGVHHPFESHDALDSHVDKIVVVESLPFHLLI
ncbi:hypothetical protein BT93_G0729 [Corymbia citriodora subsp. variegata]|nr:hypothetical protein BT93_G0729 [Corymbia citriodora subsp. variegata]